MDPSMTDILQEEPRSPYRLLGSLSLGISSVTSTVAASVPFLFLRGAFKPMVKVSASTRGACVPGLGHAVKSLCRLLLLVPPSTVMLIQRVVSLATV